MCYIYLACRDTCQLIITHSTLLKISDVVYALSLKTLLQSSGRREKERDVSRKHRREPQQHRSRSESFSQSLRKHRTRRSRRSVSTSPGQSRLRSPVHNREGRSRKSDTNIEEDYPRSPVHDRSHRCMYMYTLHDKI